MLRAKFPALLSSGRGLISALRGTDASAMLPLSIGSSRFIPTQSRDMSSETTLPKAKLGPEELTKRVEQLTEVQYYVTQEKGTEMPGTGAYLKLSETGMYHCVVCDSELFSSATKFDSGCGWPAFYDIIDPRNVTLTEDKSHGMRRTEATCSGCGSHLGHVFPDGVGTPTGQRYCINSASLKFQKR